MIDRTNSLTLRELALEYSFILMDTSVLYEKLADDVKNSSPGKEEYITERLKFFGLLEDCLSEGVPFFITSSVYHEYIGGHFPYKKIIRNKEVQQNRKRLDLTRKIMKMEKQGRKMIDLLSEKGRIIQLTEKEKELYNSLYNTPYGQICYKLGEVDADLLISGAVLSEMRGSTCLVSNDFGIFHQWKDFLNIKKTNKKQFGFAVRTGINGFKILDNKYYQKN